LVFSLWGVCLLGALDSSVIFFLPLAVDIGVIFLSSKAPHLSWFYAILVSLTSVLGAAVTFYVGNRIGESGLERIVPKRKLDPVLGRARKKGATAMALLALIPPPFPFTAFILTAGALDVNPVRFLLPLFFAKLVRFEIEALLAARFGGRIIELIQAPQVRLVAELFTLLVIVGSAVTVYTLVRRMKTRRQLVGKAA
jgi:membrane protein YqaA with SNARE-associated domain